MVDDLQRRLGQRIRELRIKQGYTSQDAFAEYMGVNRTIVGFWETQRKDLRLSTLVRIAEGLGITLSELFQGLEGDAKAKAPKPGSVKMARILRDVDVLEEHVKKLRATLGGGAQQSDQRRRNQSVRPDRGMESKDK